METFFNLNCWNFKCNLFVKKLLGSISIQTGNKKSLTNNGCFKLEEKKEDTLLKNQTGGRLVRLSGN